MRTNAATIRLVRISPPDYRPFHVFDELVEALDDGLTRAGFTVRHQVNELDAQDLNLVIGGHLLSDEVLDRLPDNVILYNFEQLAAGSTLVRPAYLNALARGRHWDYSQRNIDALRQAFPSCAMQRVPVAYSPVLTRLKPAPVQDIDVLFYGTVNERRQRVLQALADAGLRVQVGFSVFGTERDELIRRAKLIVNIHYYDTHVLETVRLSYLMANAKAIVSECAPDTEIDRHLADGLCLVPYEKIVDSCRILLALDDEREQLEARALQAVRRVTYAAVLKRELGRRQGPSSLHASARHPGTSLRAAASHAEPDVGNLLSPIPSSHRTAHCPTVFQTYYDETHRHALCPAATAFNIQPYLSSDSREYELFKKIYSAQLAADKPWGLVSWKFETKTGISLDEFIDFSEKQLAKGFDCTFINPMIGNEAIFCNVWEQGVANHPSMRIIIDHLMPKIGHTINKLSCCDTFAFCNYFVANSNFWLKYFSFIESIIDMLEREKTQQTEVYKTWSGLAGYHRDPRITMRPFIIERLFSSFIMTNTALRIAAFTYKEKHYKEKFGTKTGKILYSLSQIKQEAMSCQAPWPESEWSRKRTQIIASPLNQTILVLDDPPDIIYKHKFQ